MFNKKILNIMLILDEKIGVGFKNRLRHIWSDCKGCKKKVFSDQEGEINKRKINIFIWFSNVFRIWALEMILIVKLLCKGQKCKWYKHCTYFVLFSVESSIGKNGHYLHKLFFKKLHNDVEENQSSSNYGPRFDLKGKKEFFLKIWTWLDFERVSSAKLFSRGHLSSH